MDVNSDSDNTLSCVLLFSNSSFRSGEHFHENVLKVINPSIDLIVDYTFMGKKKQAFVEFRSAELVSQFIFQNSAVLQSLGLDVHHSRFPHVFNGVLHQRAKETRKVVLISFRKASQVISADTVIGLLGIPLSPLKVVVYSRNQDFHALVEYPSSQIATQCIDILHNTSSPFSPFSLQVQFANGLPSLVVDRNSLNKRDLTIPAPPRSSSSSHSNGLISYDDSFARDTAFNLPPSYHHSDSEVGPQPRDTSSTSTSSIHPCSRYQLSYSNSSCCNNNNHFGSGMGVSIPSSSAMPHYPSTNIQQQQHQSQNHQFHTTNIISSTSNVMQNTSAFPYLNLSQQNQLGSPSSSSHHTQVPTLPNTAYATFQQPNVVHTHQNYQHQQQFNAYSSPNSPQSAVSELGEVLEQNDVILPSFNTYGQQLPNSNTVIHHDHLQQQTTHQQFKSLDHNNNMHNYINSNNTPYSDHQLTTESIAIDGFNFQNHNIHQNKINGHQNFRTQNISPLSYEEFHTFPPPPPPPPPY